MHNNKNSWYNKSNIVVEKERVTIRVVYIFIVQVLEINNGKERQDKNINFQNTMTNLVITKNKSFVGIVFENRIIFVVLSTLLQILSRKKVVQVLEITELSMCKRHLKRPPFVL